MLTGLLGQLVLVVSGIAVARMLSVHDRGLVALAVVIPVIAVEIGTIGVPRALTLHLSTGGDPNTVRSLALPLAGVQGVALVAVSVLAVLAVSLVQPDFIGLGLLATAYVPSGIVLAYELAWLQGVHAFASFNVMRLFAGATYAGLVALLFALGSDSAYLVVAVWLTAYVAAAVILIGVTRRKLKQWSFNDAADIANRPLERSDLVQTGLRFLPASLLPLGSMRADHLVVGLALPAASLGYYAIASSVCNLPRFLAQSAGMIAYPLSAARDGGSAGGRIIITSTVVGGIVVVALILVADPLIPILFGEDYRPAVTIARVLLVAAFLFGVRRVATDALLGTDRPRLGFVAEISAWFIYGAAIAATWQSLDAFGFAVSLAAAAGVSLAVLGLLTAMSRRRRESNTG